jgi:hypothetical protein
MNTPQHIELLKDIRAELREGNRQLASFCDELRAVRPVSKASPRLGDDLSQQLVESDLRTRLALAELALGVRDLAAIMRCEADLRPRVERCESEIAELKKRLPAEPVG